MKLTSELVLHFAAIGYIHGSTQWNDVQEPVSASEWALSGYSHWHCL